MTNTWEERANALEELAKKRQAEREASLGHRTRMATPPATSETPGLLTFDEAMKTLPGWQVQEIRKSDVIEDRKFGDPYPFFRESRPDPLTPIFNALADRLGFPLAGI